MREDLLFSLSAQKLPCSSLSASAWRSRLIQGWEPGHLGNAESVLRVFEQEFPNLDTEPQEPRELWVPSFLPFGGTGWAPSGPVREARMRS